MRAYGVTCCANVSPSTRTVMVIWLETYLGECTVDMQVLSAD